MDRENSFEDLEQFLTQLDWAPPRGSTDDTGSDLELTWDPTGQAGQERENIQELEMRALSEHLKAIVKDIHIAIGDQMKNHFQNFPVAIENVKAEFYIQLR